MRKVVSLLVLLSGMASAERVDLVVKEQLREGQALHASAPIPELGNGDPLLSTRMIERAPGEWFLPLDIPAGTVAQARIYQRPVDPKQYADPSAVTLLRDVPLQDGTLAASNGKLTLHVPRRFASVTVNFMTPVTTGKFSSRKASMERQGGSGEYSEFMVTVPRGAQAYQVELGTPMDATYTVPSHGPAWFSADRDLWIDSKASEILWNQPQELEAAARIERFTLAPRGFLPRQISVRLPKGYDPAKDHDLPLLVALDGQNVFAPGGSFGCWNLDTAVDEAIAKGEIPKLIVVAIDNTPERFAEYVPNRVPNELVEGRGEEFLSMVRDELLPIVRKEYTVTTTPAKTGLIGSSLGGLIGLTAVDEFSDTFGVVAALSPSSQLNTALLKEQIAAPGKARLWMDSGSAGVSTDGFARTMQLRDAYLLGGGALGPDFMHIVAPGEQHNEAAWSHRAPQVIRWMFGQAE